MVCKQDQTTQQIRKCSVVWQHSFIWRWKMCSGLQTPYINNQSLYIYIWTGCTAAPQHGRRNPGRTRDGLDVWVHGDVGHEEIWLTPRKEVCGICARWGFLGELSGAAPEDQDFHWTGLWYLADLCAVDTLNHGEVLLT